MQSYDNIWELVYQDLSSHYSETILTLWFSHLKLIAVSDRCVVLLSGSDMKADIIHKRMLNVMKQSFESVMGFAVDVVVLSNQSTPVDPEEIQNQLNQGKEMKSFSISDSSQQPYTEKNDPQSTPSSEVIAASAATKEDKENIRYQHMLKERMKHDETRQEDSSNFASQEYTFENFIVGNSNKFAHAACIAIANSPATAYNPLFIYGPSGIGKTHLLYAIRNHARENNPDFHIIYVKGEDFTSQMIEAITNKTTAQFREKCRKADILLIDDVQFIAGKAATQEEFFNTFNALYDSQKQIVLTSDKPPKEMKTLEDRLRTRFEGGLMADIQPPDYELRMAILKRKAQIMQIDIPIDVLNFLGDKLNGNIRKIEGAIKRLGAYQNLNREKITLENTKEILADIMTGPVPENIKIEKIFSTVAKKYGVTVEEIKGKKRTRDIAMARHIAIYIVRKMTDKSFPEIGNMFNRDHTTILSSSKVIDQKIKEDILIESEVNDLMKEISSIS